jgi:asparagine N-glycosylation enzyme membrane subunit Stt3
MSNNLDELKDAEKSGSERNGSVIMAVIFIVVGVGLIVSNITGFSFNNWWVLFMLIPVALFAQNIYRDYQANGRLTSQSTGSIIASLAILAGAAVFLFEAITWSMIWPIGLIITGLSMYLGTRS